MTGLIRLLFLFLVVLGVVSLVRGIVAPAKTRPPSPGGKARTGKLFKDPVCGTYVTSDGSPSTKHGGETLYFCSEDCREKFLTPAS